MKLEHHVTMRRRNCREVVVLTDIWGENATLVCVPVLSTEQQKLVQISEFDADRLCCQKSMQKKRKKNELSTYMWFSTYVDSTHIDSYLHKESLT